MQGIVVAIESQKGDIHEPSTADIDRQILQAFLNTALTLLEDVQEEHDVYHESFKNGTKTFELHK